MVTLEDRIPLLFDAACPAWSSRRIALAPGRSDDEVRDELRRMAQKRLVSIMDPRENPAVLLVPGGEAARDAFLDSFPDRSR